jgi:hypothetical protein
VVFWLCANVSDELTASIISTTTQKIIYIHIAVKASNSTWFAKPVFDLIL